MYGIISDHKLSRLLVPAFLHSINAKQIINSSEKVPNDKIPVFFGSELYFSHIKPLIYQKRKFIYIDHAYLNRKQFNKKNPYFRVICNDLHPNYFINKDSSRVCEQILDNNIVKPKGDKIIFCMPSLVQLDTLHVKINKLLLVIQKSTDRKIEVRFKKQKKSNLNQLIFNQTNRISISKDNFFEDTIKSAWSCISLNSVIGVRSLYFGVPVFCVNTDPAKICAETNFTKIEEPKCIDTTNFFKHITWCEFSVDEIKSGYALDSIIQYI